ncbi:MAG: TIR domain-containing protein [Verrucomicrobiaceae bacterium]|nr:TIR domain-containing protein [Verrucomicrobiaceae bacterium]
MPDDFRFDVFLSHSSKDKPVVRDIAERLKKDGVKVWFDEWEIKPGDSIPAKIEEGLERSRVLVLCMSANAFGSDWAQLESGTFRFRDPLNKERRFLPLCLDDAPIKGSLAQFLYINWLPAEREQEYAKLREVCLHPTTWPLPKETKARQMNNDQESVDSVAGTHRKQRQTSDKSESDRLVENLTPFKVLTAALSHVPGLRILFGVVGVLAILAIARVWSLDRGWTIVGACAVVLLSFVLLVLAKFSASKTSEFRGPAKVLMWFCVLLFMVWCALLTGCVFFKWPVPVSMLPLSPVPQPSTNTVVISGLVTIDGRPASDRRDLKLVCDTDAGLSLEAAVLSGARFRIVVPPGTASATVTARAGNRMGKTVFDIRAKEQDKTITLEPIESGLPLLRIFDERRLGPLDSVRTKDGDQIPLSYARSEESAPPRITTFSTVITSSESISAFDAEATIDPVFVDNAVVRVTHWSPPPPIADMLMVFPAARMHVSYVQIDAPKKDSEGLFRAPFLSDAGPIYISLRPDEPERLAIIAGATTPGVYTFDVGLECHSRDSRSTVWAAHDVQVYFAGPEIREAQARVFSKSKQEQEKDRRIQELLKTNPAKVLLPETDADWSEIESAIEVLTKPDPTAFAAAMTLHKSGKFANSSPLNEEIIACIARTGGENALQFLTECIKSDEWGEPKSAVFSLLEMNTPASIAILKTAVAEKRKSAIEALIETASAHAPPGELQADLLPFIHDALTDAREYTRDEALGALAKLKPEEAIVKAKDWLASDKDEDILLGAKYCAILGAKELFGLVDSAFNRLKDDAHKKDLIPSLCSFASERDIQRLLVRLREFKDDVESADLILNALTRLTGQHMGFIQESDGEAESRNEAVIARWEKHLKNRY